MLGLLVLLWISSLVMILTIWARFHANVRAQDGIDEEAYINGFADERPRLRRLSNAALRAGVPINPPKSQHPRKLVVTFAAR